MSSFLFFSFFFFLFFRVFFLETVGRNETNGQHWDWQRLLDCRPGDVDNAFGTGTWSDRGLVDLGAHDEKASAPTSCYLQRQKAATLPSTKSS